MLPFTLLYSLHTSTYFITQPLSKPDHICQTLQGHFDSMLCNVLDKNLSFPEFTLLLGGIFQYVRAKKSSDLGARIVASSYLIWQRGEGHILDNTGLFGPNGIISRTNTLYIIPGTSGFFRYLTELLESPE